MIINKTGTIVAVEVLNIKKTNIEVEKKFQNFELK